MLIGAVIGAFLVCLLANIVANKLEPYEKMNWGKVSFDVLTVALIGAIIGYFVS